MNKKYTSARPSLNAELERQVKVEAGHCCSVRHCNEHTYLEIHHIDEDRENNTLENLVLLCDKHHKMAHAKRITRKELREYKNGLSIKEYINRDDEFYNELIDFITENMYLNYWINISDNLIGTAIESKILDGFDNVITKVFRTELPDTYPELNKSINNLANHTSALVEHFTDSENAYLLDNQKWWQRDMRWKKNWLPSEEYDEKYNKVESWQNELFKKHCNLVVALNEFSSEVSKTINSYYMNREKFVVCDSLGTTNSLNAYEYIPNEYEY